MGLERFSKRNNGARCKVTTIIPSYNQQDYIERAIESAVAQKGDFVHEIIVSSDGSTDRTRSIVDVHRKNFPGLIVDISQDCNVGISGNFKRLIDIASGEYLAILEGDDYWTDDRKLWEQKEFLKRNGECSMVFSKIKVHNVNKGRFEYLQRQEDIKKTKLSGRDFLDDPSMNLIANFSCCLFRTDLMKTAPKVIFSKRISEIAVAFYLEKIGSIGYIDKPMSVYSQHPQGVWSGSSREMQLRSGLETRLIVKQVARDQYKGDIQRIIDEKFQAALTSGSV